MPLLDSLPHVCTAKRRVRTVDAIGGARDGFATLFTGRACWRQPASDGEIESAQARDQRITHKVYFAADPELDERDVLEIDGDAMSVRSATHPDASVGMGWVWKVMVLLED